MAPIEFIIIINVVELIEEMWKPEEHMCLKSDFGPMINLWSLNETKAVDTRQPCIPMQVKLRDHQSLLDYMIEASEH